MSETTPTTAPPTTPAPATVKRRFNRLKDKPDNRDYKYAAPGKKKPVAVVPEDITPIDLRPGQSPVNDQGNAGSCVGEACIGLHEFLEIKEGHPVALSQLFLYRHARVIENTEFEDAGCSIRDGMKTIADKGSCKEELWPYDLNNLFAFPPQPCWADAWHRTISVYSSINQNEADMTACLEEGYPFVVGISVYDSFLSDAVTATGEVPMPDLKKENNLGGHAVLVVGRRKDGSWICKNSWGDGWGDKGYFYLPWPYLLDPNLAGDIWTARK